MFNLFTRKSPVVGEVWTRAGINPFDISTIKILEVKGDWLRVDTGEVFVGKLNFPQNQMKAA